MPDPAQETRQRAPARDRSVFPDVRWRSTFFANCQRCSARSRRSDEILMGTVCFITKPPRQ
eukprot:3347665-Pyramimonas_sp.AAC.1